MSSASSSCKHCSSPCCVSYGGAPFCLLHYHAFSTHGKDDTMKAIITNEEEATKQFPMVESVLRGAMTDVILRMHELQQNEQATLRADPLSVLALHAPSSNQNAAAMDVSVPILRESARERSEELPKSKKLKKDDLWMVSSKARDNSSSTKKNEQLNQGQQLLRQVSGEDMDSLNDYLYSKGPRCSQCSSDDTLVKYDSSSVSMSGTRGETWGNKDNEGGHSKSTVMCKACGFELAQESF
mmetsp:Transcript_17126/g.28617  ORF Transcript_17126/g.28617 Transcript_17126/m.28617 type:complete len:240 (-) Transcript_17126:52-771(-)